MRCVNVLPHFDCSAVMAKDTVGYLCKKKAEAPNADASQVWTELEDLHSKRYAASLDINTLGVNWNIVKEQVMASADSKVIDLCSS